MQSQRIVLVLRSIKRSSDRVKYPKFLLNFNNLELAVEGFWS
jgi:hypothetical protein